MTAVVTVVAVVSLLVLMHGCGSDPDGKGGVTSTKHQVSTSPTTSTTTIWLPKCTAALVRPVDSVSVADNLNKKFTEGNGTGLLVRNMSPLPDICANHSCEPWTLNFSNSFMLMSTWSWSERDHRHSVFVGSWYGEQRVPYGWPGFVASSSVLDNMVTCSWPWDGGTGARNKESVGDTPANCGCASWEGDCQQPDEADWCSVEPHGRACAYPPEWTYKMMENFKNGGGGDFNWGRSGNLWGYNEVLVHREKWYAALPDSIGAFVIPRDCPPGSKCYNSLAFWYPDFKAKFGPWPIVHFDADNKDAPFSALPQLSDSGLCEVADCVPCSGNYSEICHGDTCCADGSICPSASEGFTGCDKPKVYDCTKENKEKLI